MKLKIQNMIIETQRVWDLEAAEIFEIFELAHLCESGEVLGKKFEGKGKM
jgi:hypothetical protein